MLKPAIMYKDEIYQKSICKTYTEQGWMYNGGGSSNIEIEIVNNNPDQVQYAILDKDEVIGYLGYYVSHRDAKVNGIALMSFTDTPNVILGLDVKREMLRLLRNKRIHKISWWACGENPAIRAYRKFCKAHNGNVIRIEDDYINKDGEFCDSYMFEIIKR